MNDFVLEEELENVINRNTKKYLDEVVSSYNNGNYRATVVVLYTAVIYDLLHKLVALKEIYNDRGAEKILDDITEQQKKNPRSPEWEGNLIERVYKETKIISAVEREELLYLKSERNYAAHPIINFDDINEQLELKVITKETARDLIRKAFEIVFLKDAILAKDIVEDFVSDLNEFHARAKTDGLENFLKTKYFSRMTLERKDQLFKSLWKFVFLLNNDNCNENRESNYWGLLYLYNGDKNHYRSVVRDNEDIYLNKLKLETIENWDGKSSKDIARIDIMYFNSISRILYFIKFLEDAPEMYKDLNAHAKNIVKQSIDHMYIKENVVENALYLTSDKNADLFKEQVRIKAKAVFMSDDVVQHFEMIHKMLDNYTNTEKNWFESSYYDILDAEDLKQIFLQSEQRGCIDQFVKFFIKYCTRADTFWQAKQMFDFLKIYQKYYKREHYYMILAEMDNNSQYFNNNERGTFIKNLEEMYLSRFNTELLQEPEEKYLYHNLFSNIQIKDCDVKRILELIEERAVNYACWKLRSLIFDLDESQCRNILKKEKISSFGNILKVLGDKNDPGYSEYYANKFKGYFE